MPFENPKPPLPVEKPEEEPVKKEESKEERIIKKLNFYKDTARKILSGERIFGETVYDDFKKSVAEAEEEGIDISTVKAEAEEIIAQIPSAEINNVLKKAEEYLESGDIAHSKSWHADAERRIRDWESKGALKSEEVLDLQKRVNAIGARLY